MSIIKNPQVTKYGAEGTFEFDLFNAETKVSFQNIENLGFAEECAEYANSLSEETIEQLAQACIRYCNDFLHSIGEPPKQFPTPTEVFNLISPSILIVCEPHPDFGPVVHMELNCSWEEEHGMEWVIRDDIVFYVGQYTDEYEWRTEKNDESWNYA